MNPKRDCLICSFLQLQARAMSLPFDEVLIGTAAAIIGAIERFGVQRVIKNLCVEHRAALHAVQQATKPGIMD